MSGITAEARHHHAFPGENEAALLVTSLRGLPFDVPHDTDWRALLGMARENGVLQLVHQSVLEMGAEVPALFSAAAQERRASAEKLASELEGLLQSFAEQEIDVLPLKGPAMALTLYRDAAMRSCKDLDLLVHRDDYSRAEALLLDRGFGSKTRDEYHGKFVLGELLVELHLEVASPRYFPFNTQSVWHRSQPHNFRGKPMRVMCDEDLILYLCLHGLKHGFSRLIWILDLARAMNASADLDYKALKEWAKQEGLEPWLLIGGEVVRAMLPQQLPDEMDALIAESPERARRANQIAASLFTERDHKFRSFYLQLESSARRRWRSRLGYLVPTPKDYEWAMRHGISRRLMPALRPFRVLVKYGPKRAWRIMFPLV